MTTPSTPTPVSAKKVVPTVTVTPVNDSFSDSSSSSTKSISIEPAQTSPRKARFAEVASVQSPIEPQFASRSQSYTTYTAEAQPSDVGFGYLSEGGGSIGVEMPITPFSPLKSAMRMPGAQNRLSVMTEGVLSPTFREERLLDKREESTEKEQAKDLKVKTRVRIAKFLLRSTNLACSFIVMSMLSTTFSIFNATKALPTRNGLPAWAVGTKVWPQLTLLIIACISLTMSIVVLWRYRAGGQKRADKAAMYYTTFSMAFFGFNIVMWMVGAGILHGSHANGNDKDIWGWSCNDNTRKALFDNQVQYDTVCRFQQWSLVCAIISIIVEVFTIGVSLIIFSRLWSKRRLRKSMAARDRARSDLYLANLRAQSAPNSPGLARHASYAAQHGDVVSRDAYVNPFMTPAGPLTGAPLLTAGYRAAEEGFAAQMARGPPSVVYQPEVVAVPSRDTTSPTSATSATSGSRPFVLAAPPSSRRRKGKQVEGATSPGTFSVGSSALSSPGGLDEARSIVPTPTSGMAVTQRATSMSVSLGNEPGPAVRWFDAEPQEWRTSAVGRSERPDSVAWAYAVAEEEGKGVEVGKQEVEALHVAAAPGELIYESVPIPRAYGSS